MVHLCIDYRCADEKEKKDEMKGELFAITCIEFEFLFQDIPTMLKDEPLSLEMQLQILPYA
jgi:hypothetical protein